MFNDILKIISSAVCLSLIVLVGCNKEQNTVSNEKGLFSVQPNSIEQLEYYTNTYVDCNEYDTVINSAYIEGYTDKQSYFPGETIRYYIHCLKKSYSIELYRIGKEHQLLFSEQNIIAERQNYLCHSYATGCNWNNNFSFEIPLEYSSGMYSAKLIDIAGNSAWVTFIIKPIEPNSNILVLASTNTWQAYNAWGGGSFYSYLINDDLPNAANVSFLRPNPNARPIKSDKNMHLADAESYLLEWMEKENITYDSYADIDIHNDVSLLSKYKLLIIHVHPEYWSQRMLEYLKEYLDNGGNLMYLGGNGLHWKVVMNTEMNILEVRKNNDLHFFLPSPGGLWRDLGFPQSTLLGVRYDSRGYGTFHPFAVHDENHWALANTNLKKGVLFSTECDGCGGGSGHETDKIDENSPKVDTIAIGTNPDNGGAHMIYYQTNGGGQIFSASSISYTRTLEVDNNTSIITKNVIDRFTK